MANITIKDRVYDDVKTTAKTTGWAISRLAMLWIKMGQIMELHPDKSVNTIKEMAMAYLKD